MGREWDGKILTAETESRGTNDELFAVRDCAFFVRLVWMALRYTAVIKIARI